MPWTPESEGFVAVQGDNVGGSGSNGMAAEGVESLWEETTRRRRNQGPYESQYYGG